MKIFIREKNNHLNDEVLDNKEHKLKEKEESKNPHEKPILTSKDLIDSIDHILIASQKPKENSITGFRNDEQHNW